MMMNYDTTKKWIRQGDVLLRPVVGPAREGNCISDGIIARGEITGHSHRIESLEAVEHYDLGDGRQLLCVGPHGVSIVHEEHGTVRCDPNTDYEIVIDREFDYIAEMERKVVD